MPYPWKSIREWIAEEEKLGNVLRIKTSVKCGDYSNIVDLGNGIPGEGPETEIRAVTRYLHSLPGKPIGIIENPVNNRPDIPVILNPWPSRERVLRGLGCKDKEEFLKKLVRVRRERVKASVVPKSQAPCKEVIIPEDKVDLRESIPRCWVEFNQVLWSTCNGTIIVYDPETGTHDLGKCRLAQYDTVYDWKKDISEERLKNCGFLTLIYSGAMQSHAGRYYYENYRKKNRPMPAAFAFDLTTDLNVVAAFRRIVEWPETGDEYEATGVLRGEPVEVTESETIPGLMVPAHAEWVFEGEVLPEDEIAPPYAEDIASGYMFGGENCPVFRIKCITHRKDPLWASTTFSGNGQVGGHEGPHSGLIVVNSELDAIQQLRDVGFKVKDVVIPTGGRMVAIVQLEVDGSDKFPHYGKTVGMALRGYRIVGQALKYTIIVGPDIDPYDFKDVMWALATRTMPVSDSIMIEKGLATWGDPGGFPGPLGWKSYGEQMIIDALIKVPERYETYAPRSEPTQWEREAIKRIEEKLG